jgi:hypothetical protein
MASSDQDKRAKIIAAQAARESADRAAGKLPALPEPRTNWAGMPSRGRRRPRGRPPKLTR